MKPSPTRPILLTILTLLVILLGVIFYLAITDPLYLPLDSPPNPRKLPISELNFREIQRWMQFKGSPNPTQFENDNAIEIAIVTGTTGGGWRTDMLTDCEWDDGYPTPSGGNLTCKPSRPWSKRVIRIKLIRTAATLNSPASWRELHTP